MQRLGDGALQFRHPNGWLIPEAPKPPDVASDAGEALRAQNGTAGAALDANTLRPDWDGSGLNLGWAIDGLHPRANGGR